MVTTSPDNLFSPDAAAQYKLTTDLAAMQDTVQAALTARASRPQSAASPASLTEGTYVGQRAVVPSGGSVFEFVWSGTKWFAVAGQVLASARASTTTSAMGGLIIRARTPMALSSGQKLRIVSSPISMYHTAQGQVLLNVRGRSSNTDVTSTTGTALQLTRNSVPGGSLVVSSSGIMVDASTDVDNVAYSAALFLGSAGTTYGTDPQILQIISA